MRSLRAWLHDLKCHTGGNTAILMAVGLPMLIGSAGLAVDLAQWYMWKGEMQYAADQAALAGAWARTSNKSKEHYVARARQEYTANLSTTASFTDTPSVNLASYASGASNSVAVVATATRTLPFSGIMMGRGVTVRVSAQASFAEGLAYTSCLIATDTNDSGAITIGGNSKLTAACGIASLSTSASSIVVNGNPSVNSGWVVSAGGIDDWFNLHTNDSVHENMTNLFDPFASLTPPTNTTARTYSCAGGVASAAATVATKIDVAYSYYSGANANNATAYSGYASPRAGSSNTTTLDNQAAPAGTVEGSSSTPSSVITNTQVGGSGNSKIYERKTTTTTYTYTNVVESDTGQGSVQPGTYTGGIQVKCNTVFSSGIYVINGGGLQIDGRYQVTGSGVMFVLKNGAYLKINGGSSVTLTAPTSSQLVSAGVSATEAAKLSGMLVFEDRLSSTTNKTRINGNATTVLNGVLYFPVNTMNFAGTATVTSQCLMIAANNIVIEGTADMSTFCPPNINPDDYISSGASIVKLVS